MNRNTLMEMSSKISESCEVCGSGGMFGVRIDSCDPTLLDPREGNIGDHVAIQMGAISYFGSALKDAERFLEEENQLYDFWRKEKFGELLAELSENRPPSKPPSSTEIEAEIIRRYGDESRKMVHGIMELKRIRDNIKVWYEAWDRKGFALNQFVKLQNDELFAKDNMVGPDREQLAALNSASNWKKVREENRVTARETNEQLRQKGADDDDDIMRKKMKNRQPPKNEG